MDNRSDLPFKEDEIFVDFRNKRIALSFEQVELIFMAGFDTAYAFSIRCNEGTAENVSEERNRIVSKELDRIMGALLRKTLMNQKDNGK